MRRPIRALLVTVAALAAAAAPAAAYVPPAKTLYADGPTGRYLLGGRWLFRLDPGDRGLRHHWMRSRSSAGWRAVSVPNAWNANDPSSASMLGGVGWYRKDFRLPSASAALAWAVRFESVNYRARVWLNGKPVGANTGAYLPFELRLRALARRGTNRLVVRVDSRRTENDLPPAGRSAAGGLRGGWWNWSGILREVYLQRLDTVAFRRVVVRPSVACSTCSARVRLSLSVRNVGRAAHRLSASASFGGRRVALGVRMAPAGGQVTFSRLLRIAHPRLWSPDSPTLYRVRFTVRAGGRPVAGYHLHAGLRSINVVGGRLMLNGRPLDFRGVGLHEEVKGKGFAISNADRRRLVGEAKALGANALRVHYPFSPYVQELADRLGLLIWSEIPVYGIKPHDLAHASVRRAALSQLRRNILANENHPSVMLWSIGNELSPSPDAAQRAYIAAAARLARGLDPSRPVGLAIQGYPGSLCQARAYAPLDVIGINDYFGWYTGPSAQIFDRLKLSGYLDAARACYRRQALAVTEFGAEADRSGPVEEKGTYAFQQAFVDFHLGVYATKPWLSGAIYWALDSFWVRPGWQGGNPRPQPPLFQKSLITQDFVRKPAWSDVQRWFARTPLLAPAS